MISTRWVSALVIAIVMMSSGQVVAQSSSSSSASSGPTRWGPPPAGYIECARDGQVCTFSGTRNVLIQSCFETLCSQRTVVATGSLRCSVSGSATRCSYSVAETAPIAQFRDLVATASTQSGASRSAGKAIDGDTSTRWEASNTSAGSWLQVKRAQPFYLTRVEIAESGQRIRGYRVEYLNGTSWEGLQEGVSVGPKLIIDISEYGLRVVNGIRIITTATATGQPSISEFSVFGKPLSAPQ